jgi:hypothetical protein
VSAPLQTLEKSGVPLLMTGQHALIAHGFAGKNPGNEVECAISTDDETLIYEYFTRNEWSIVYRTPFFAKFRLLSTGTPVIRVLFLDPTTFGQLRADSSEHTFESIPLRVPSLIHVVAMKLQAIKHEPHREIEDLPEILAILRANMNRWKPEELDAACKRFGPKGIYTRIKQRLAS